MTQLYMFRIAQTIIEILNKHAMSLWKKRHVTSRTPKLQNWSSLPHPLLQKEYLSSEARLSKKFGRFIKVVYHSKKKEFNVQSFHDEPEPCASVIELNLIASHILIPIAKSILVATRCRSSSRRTPLISVLHRQTVHWAHLPRG